jgi:hypothetical protein
MNGFILIKSFTRLHSICSTGWIRKCKARLAKLKPKIVRLAQESEIYASARQRTDPTKVLVAVLDKNENRALIGISKNALIWNTRALNFVSLDVSGSVSCSFMLEYQDGYIMIGNTEITMRSKDGKKIWTFNRTNISTRIKDVALVGTCLYTLTKKGHLVEYYIDQIDQMPHFEDNMHKIISTDAYAILYSTTAADLLYLTSPDTSDTIDLMNSKGKILIQIPYKCHSDRCGTHIGKYIVLALATEPNNQKFEQAIYLIRQDGKLLWKSAETLTLKKSKTIVAIKGFKCAKHYYLTLEHTNHTLGLSMVKSNRVIGIGIITVDTPYAKLPSSYVDCHVSARSYRGVDMLILTSDSIMTCSLSL